MTKIYGRGDKEIEHVGRIVPTLWVTIDVFVIYPPLYPARVDLQVTSKDQTNTAYSLDADYARILSDLLLKANAKANLHNANVEATLKQSAPAVPTAAGSEAEGRA